MVARVRSGRGVKRALAIGIHLMVIVGVVGPAQAHESSSLLEQRRHTAHRAKALLGANYCYGGESECFDCSGFTYAVYRRHGAWLPRPTEWQWRARHREGWATRWSRRKLQKGDLVFFENTWKRGISHVGIYMGRSWFIHSNDDGVNWDSLRSDYWRNHFVAGVRPRRFTRAYYR